MFALGISEARLFGPFDVRRRSNRSVTPSIREGGGGDYEHVRTLARLLVSVGHQITHFTCWRPFKENKKKNAVCFNWRTVMFNSRIIKHFNIDGVFWGGGRFLFSAIGPLSNLWNLIHKSFVVLPFSHSVGLLVSCDNSCLNFVQLSRSFIHVLRFSYALTHTCTKRKIKRFKNLI